MEILWCKNKSLLHLGVNRNSYSYKIGDALLDSFAVIFEKKFKHRLKYILYVLCVPLAKERVVKFTYYSFTDDLPGPSWQTHSTENYYRLKPDKGVVKRIMPTTLIDDLTDLL